MTRRNEVAAIIVGMRSGAGGWLGLSTSERLPFIEGIRGILALYVVLGHIASMADPSFLAGRKSESPAWMQSALAPFAYGHLAVAGFIVLSGFCLQLSLFATGNGTVRHGLKFFGRRARRILPTYYAALALSLLVCLTVTYRMPGMPFDLYLPVTVDNTIAHLLLIQNWRPDWMYKINGVMWSIAIEAQLYVIFPALALLLRRFGRISLLVSTLAISVLATLAIPNGIKLYPWYLALFSMGMLGASYAYRPSVRRAPSATPGWIAAAIGVGWIGIALTQNWEIPIRDLGIGIVIASITFAMTLDPHALVPRLLSCRPLFWLGSMSYSLYLVHHPIQQVLYFLRPASIQSNDAELGYLLLMLPVILATSWAFYHWFERPFARGNSDTAQEPPDSFFTKRLPLLSANEMES